MDKPIDLGVSSKEMYGGESPIAIGDSDDKKRYPSFTYSGRKSLGLPKRGKMTIDFCVTRETESEYEDGEDHYECTIKVEKILDVEGEKDERPSKRDMSAEDALDALARAVKHSEPDEDDEG